MEDAAYFFTEQRWQALQDTLALQRSGAQDSDESRKHGTVGVVDALAPVGGSCGVIAVDENGVFSMPFNCAGMYRGVATGDGVLRTAIYQEPLAEYPSAA